MILLLIAATIALLVVMAAIAVWVGHMLERFDDDELTEADVEWLTRPQGNVDQIGKH